MFAILDITKINVIVAKNKNFIVGLILVQKRPIFVDNTTNQGPQFTKRQNWLT